MALAPGTRLGPYEISAQIGAGGMGEVYRARDSRLGRDVAVKVLPSAFSADPERLRRFEDEARAAARLNHPNILAVYDVGTHASSPYIVSELLEGETLRTRLATTSGGGSPEEKKVGKMATSNQVAGAGRGIAVRKAIDYASQMTRGLAAAHDRGIVHRDLKPENVFITADGQVKILDFGLAKLVQTEPVQDGRTGSPTRAVSTAPGILLGTVGYMAPEQVRGQAVDHRADVFAFGAILYEMLAGRRAFDGPTAADTLIAILDKDPPALTVGEGQAPSALARIVDRCLEKDPVARFQSTCDLAFALEALTPFQEANSPAAVAPTTPAPLGRWRLGWTVASILGLGLIGVSVTAGLLRAPVDLHASKTSVLAPQGITVVFNQIGYPGATLALSPDGRRLAFIGADSGGRRRLWVRPLDGLSAQPLAGTEGAMAPFWSPDSQFLGFFADGKLKKVGASGGGAPLVLCDAAAGRPGGAGGGGSWNKEGVIVFAATANRRIQRVPATGGVPSPVTSLDTKNGEIIQVWPRFLPDGRHFLYLSVAGNDGHPNGVYLASIDSAERKQLLPGGSNLAYAQGHLLFLRERTLMAQPFDAGRLAFTGEALPLAEDVFAGPSGGTGAFSVSDTGSLVYEPNGSEEGSQLTWFDRSGKQIRTVGDFGRWDDVNLSPDSTRAVVSLPDPTQRLPDLWIFDLARGVPTRFTFDSANNIAPVWSPDGSRIVFSASRGGRQSLYQKASNSVGDELLSTDDSAVGAPNGWSLDGRFVVYVTARTNTTGNDLWVLPLAGDRKPFPVLQSPFSEALGQFAPDGRWLAYGSNESGKDEVYVAPFPGPGGKTRISTNGGNQPRWRRDGKEIFYLASDNKLMAATVNGHDSTFDISTVRALFETRATGTRFQYDVTPDGQRFLINSSLGSTTPTASFTLVQNWPALLKNQK